MYRPRLVSVINLEEISYKTALLSQKRDRRERYFQIEKTYFHICRERERERGMVDRSFRAPPPWREAPNDQEKTCQ